MAPLPIQPFFHELKRRKVFRVAGVYAVAAFVVLQVTDLAVAPLGLPEWTMALLWVLFTAAFPVALVLAWAFDITPDGVKRAEADERARGAAEVGRGRIPLYAGLFGAALLLGAGAFAYLAGPGVGTEMRAPITSIAVLPFADMSPGGDQGYFSDGITEELLDALARVPGLRVPARTSSFAFKGQNADVREIAAQLNVEAVLEGSVRRDGDRVRIFAQLINAADGYHLWSQSYDRRLTDIFAVQGDISAAIVDALRVELSPGERERLTVSSTENLLAYEFYLRGKEYVRRTPRGPTDNRNLAISAITLFREAIREDPEHAPAWAGLAWAYGRLTELPLQERADSSAAFARTAIRLDPGFSDGHTELGLAYLHKGEREAALERWRHAVELNPNDAWAHTFIADARRRDGEMVESLRARQRAMELDPAFYSFRASLAADLSRLGLFDQAERVVRAADRFQSADHGGWQHCQLSIFAHYRGDLEAVRLHADSVVALAPDNPYEWGCDGRNRVVLGDYQAAKRQLERFVAEEDDDSHPLLLMAHVYRKVSEPDRAERLIEKAEERLRTNWAQRPEFAGFFTTESAIHAMRGDLDAAMESLRRYADMEPGYWIWYYAFRTEFAFGDLHGHPPFEQFLAGMKTEVDRARERVLRAGL